MNVIPLLCQVRNGAVMARLNWLGDESSKGAKQSACMMVNYEYVIVIILKVYYAKTI